MGSRGPGSTGRGGSCSRALPAPPDDLRARVACGAVGRVVGEDRYALALLVERFRNPMITGSRLFTLPPGSGAAELLALANDDEVADLIAMRDLARVVFAAAVGGRRGAHRADVRRAYLAADGDLVAAGLLIDFKAGCGGKPRRDGTRSPHSPATDVYQLLGTRCWTSPTGTRCIGRHLRGAVRAPRAMAAPGPDPAGDRPDRSRPPGPAAAVRRPAHRRARHRPHHRLTTGSRRLIQAARAFAGVDDRLHVLQRFPAVAQVHDEGEDQRQRITDREEGRRHSRRRGGPNASTTQLHLVTPLHLAARSKGAMKSDSDLLSCRARD